MEPGTNLKVNVQQLNEGEINKRILNNKITLGIAVLVCPTISLYSTKIK